MSTGEVTEPVVGKVDEPNSQPVGQTENGDEESDDGSLLGKIPWPGLLLLVLVVLGGFGWVVKEVLEAAAIKGKTQWDQHLLIYNSLYAIVGPMLGAALGFGIVKPQVSRANRAAEKAREDAKNKAAEAAEEKGESKARVEKDRRKILSEAAKRSAGRPATITIGEAELDDVESLRPKVLKALESNDSMFFAREEDPQGGPPTITLDALADVIETVAEEPK